MVLFVSKQFLAICRRHLHDYIDGLTEDVPDGSPTVATPDLLPDRQRVLTTLSLRHRPNGQS
jgi:hypothetical protein